MRKIIVFLLLFSLLTWLMPQGSSALSLSPGDLIKVANNSTVYYYGYDGKRHAFPLEKIYYSWYADFSGIKTLTPTELASLALGKNINVRPGTYLVKLITDPKVYAIEPEGTLKHITSPSQASLLYGAAWQGRVIDLPDAYYGDYKDGGALGNNTHPTGTIFKYQGESDYNLLTNSYSRKFASQVYWYNYHFSDQFILTIPYQDFRYRDGDDIDEYKVALADTAQTLIVDEKDDFSNYSKAGNDYSNGRGDGLMGYYYAGEKFETKKYERLDTQINFDWGYGAAAPNMPTDHFSVRWLGRIEVPESKTYIFYSFVDDGIRLYIDNQLVIDDWHTHYAVWKEGSIYLSAGFHDIKIEYYEYTKPSSIKLYWGNKTDLVPQGRLYSK